MRGAYKEQGQILQEQVCVRIHLHGCTKSPPGIPDPVQDIKAYTYI
jgi:hypothetical protein